MSFHYWQQRGARDKSRYVRLAGGYHGETVGALGVTDVALFRAAYAPLLRDAPVLPSPGVARRRRHAFGRACDRRCARRARQPIFERDGATTAALIVEPLVQGAGGMAMYDSRYLHRARELTRSYDVHLIADEIMTGFGRTGTMFACEQAGDHAGSAVPVEGHHRRLPAAVVRACDRRGIRRVLRRRRRARIPAFAFVYRQRAGVPRGAGRARHLPRRRRHRRNRDDGVAMAQHRVCRCDAPARAQPAPVWNDRRVRRADRPPRLRAAGSPHAHWTAELLLRPIGNTVYFMPPYVVTDAEFALLVERTLAILDEC